MSGPNPQQQQVIDALDGDVYVSAGAGTGKTYTLTRRIVAAVTSLIDAGETSPLPIDRVMAITFTKAAAAELRFRIRGALLDEAARAEGGTAEVLIQCALGVDNAWISTIHSMAGRILRENAIAFGIDPSFQTLSTQEAQALELEALQFAMRMAANDEDPQVLRLMSSYPAVSHSSGAIGISELVAFLRERAKVMEGGLSALEVPPRTPDARPLEQLTGCGRALLATLELDGWSDSDRGKLADVADGLASAVSRASEWLSSYGTSSKASLSDAASACTALDSYLDAIYSFPPTTDRFGSKSTEHGDLAESYRAAYRSAATCAWSLLSVHKMDAVCRIARMAEDELARLKSRRGTSLDEDDLLSRCYAELSDPANEAIANRYRRQFAYIMVDEFQDTDRLQMKLISLLDELPHGEGDASSESACGGAAKRVGGMCTVGDIQQSIYRFRGADVDVSVSRRADLEGTSAAIIPLASNYRSHESVLRATELVFSQPAVFGDLFLRLDAARVNPDSPWCDPSFERVRFLYVHSDRKSKRTGSEGVSSEERLVVSAREVAKRFKELVDRGVSPSKMALLLGRMTNADVYSRALREAGVESVIAGGSVFADTAEAALVGDMFKYAADPHDDMSLLRLLVSPLFSVPDDALLALVRPLSADGRPHRQRLSEAFLRLDAECELPGLDEDGLRSLALARDALHAFRLDALKGDASIAVRRLLVSSGLLHRLQSQGDARSFASAGNLAKAMRIVSDIQRAGCGIAAASKAYEHHLQYEKESPGVLARSSSEFVRIMTVHSSKGLEFDHVAVADLKDGTVQRYGAAIENIGDAIYAALPVVEGDLAGKAAFDNHKKVMGFFAGRLGECGSSLAHVQPDCCAEASSELRCLISKGTRDASELVVEYMRTQELQEARRLLYVAMTRARESLLLVHSQAGAPSDSCYKGIYGDIYSAMSEHLGGIDPEAADMSARNGDISFARKFLVRESMDAAELDSIAAFLDGSQSDGREQGAFEVPSYPAPSQSDAAPYSASSSRLRSYSSLSSAVQAQNAPTQPKGGAESEMGSDLELDVEGGGESAASDVSCGGASIGSGASVGAEALESATPEDATALGTAFHRLAQMAIELASESPAPERRASVPDGALQVQVDKMRLSESQASRLGKALSLWMASEECASFLSHRNIAAEVPFSVPVDVDTERSRVSFTLEGEIDGLATDGDGAAFLIDYKTGVSPELDMAALHERHGLQAKCYAFALLSNGFESVHASFVRIEDIVAGEDGMLRPAIVGYSFDSSDIEALKDAIVSAWRYSVE